MNLSEASEHFGVREWGRSAPLAVRILRDCTEVDGCWRRRKPVPTTGYSMVQRTNGKPVLAHRAMYELMVGEIPEGMEIDHLCHPADGTCTDGIACPHRACVNPAHLHATTPRENTLRSTSFVAVNAAKTHCLNGHEFTPENTYPVRASARKHVGRGCRTCRREYLRAWRAAHPTGRAA